MSVPAQNPTGATVSLTEGATLAHVIDKYLNTPNVDLAKLEKMVELQERMARWNAETAFNGSMAAAQSEIERIAPDKANTQTKSKYASYAAMDETIRPIYSGHGLSLQFNTEESPQPGCIRIVCDVTKGGHVKQFRLDMPADGKGARGNDVMTRTHATGSAITYGRRYLLAMIFNVAIGGDDDGNAAGTKGRGAQTITEEQADTIRDLLDFLPDDVRTKFMELAGVTELSNMAAHKYDKAINWLKNKAETP